MKILLKSIIVSTLILFYCVLVNAQVIDNAEDAASRLRELYSLHAHDDGIVEGEKFTAKYPENSEIYAYFILHKDYAGEIKELKTFRDFVAKNENDSWANFALLKALIDRNEFDEALKTSEKLAISENEEFVLARVSVLAHKKETAQASELLEANLNLIKDKSRIETARAEIYFFADDKEKASAAFKSAQKLNPQNLEAFFLAGIYLSKDARFDEAIIPLQKAVKISPASYYVREPLWDALWRGQKAKTELQKQKQIAADIEQFRKLYPDSPKRLYQLFGNYEDIKYKQKELETEALLLKNFNDTAEAEKLLIYRLRNFDYYNDEKKQFDEKKQRIYAGMLAEFLKRPRHFNQKYLGEVLTNYLFATQKYKDISDEEYLRTAEEAIKYKGLDAASPFYTIVEGLIERKKYDEAERFARMGLEKTDENLKIEKETAKDLKNFERKAKGSRSTINKTLGKVLLKQKKYDEAEKYLLKSIKFEKEDNDALNLLGELYEETEKFDEAEKYYIENIVFLTYEEPNYEKLENLFKKRNWGKADGLDKYLEKVKITQKDIRREFLVSQKDAEPSFLKIFNLKTSEGKSFSSEELTGKVIVINIWATWCVPCTKELPEFQKLHKKYQTDENVAVVSLNSEEDIETINKFIKENKYNFPVILSEDYTKDVNVFPTTWFVDRSGKIIYTQLGSTKNLLEEFGWRIEELKKTAPNNVENNK